MFRYDEEGISKLKIRKKMSSFLPTSLSGLVLWLNSSDLSSITSVSGKVSNWLDKSGNSNNAVQSNNSFKPTTNSRTLNGKNVLDFDGISSRLNLPSSLFSVPAGNNTVFIVVSFDNVLDDQNRLLAGSDSGSGRWVLHRDPSSDSVTANNSNSVTGISLTVPDDISAHTLGLVRNSSAVKVFYDGSFSAPFTAENMTCTSLALGAQSSGGTYTDGIIAEVLIYNRALSDAELDIVGNYLSVGWGTYWKNLTAWDDSKTWLDSLTWRE